MTPVSKACAHCGKEQTYTSARHSYRCRNCKALMDWRQPLTCKNCQFISELSHLELKKIHERDCPKCAKPLSWSLSPELYTPNEIPLKKRLVAFLLVLIGAFISLETALTQHATLGYGRRSSSAEVGFAGAEVIAPLIAFVLFTLAMLSVIVDHYDKRFNEYRYRQVFYALISCAALAYYTAPLIKLIN